MDCIAGQYEQKLIYLLRLHLKMCCHPTYFINTGLLCLTVRYLFLHVQLTVHLLLKLALDILIETS